MGRRITGARSVRAAVVTALRLVVVALSLAGVVAMHGLSVTDIGGTHQGPVPIDPTASAAHDASDTHDIPVRMDSEAGVPTLGPAGGHTGHEMAGCIAILLGLIGLAALRLIRVGSGIGGLLASMRSAVTTSVARAPPQPIFLSLCVFRT